MKIGFSMSTSSRSLDVAVVAAKLEELGFESAWVGEHTIIPVRATTGYPYPGPSHGTVPEGMADGGDPMVALARASGVTRRLKLGSVALLPEHNPLNLAKQVATLDHLSGGRYLMCACAGWLREETQIMGGDFDHRWEQTKEAVLAMKQLWTTDPSEFHGKYYDFPSLRLLPKPRQKPHPPVLIGSISPRAFKWVMEWGDGWIPNYVSPEQVRAGRETLDRLAGEAGRDPRSIEVTVLYKPAERDLLKRYEDAGADRVVVMPGVWDEAQLLAELERIAERLFR